MLVIMDESVKCLTQEIVYTKEIIDELMEQGYIELIGNDLKKKLNEMEEMISEYYRNQMK